MEPVATYPRRAHGRADRSVCAAREDSLLYIWGHSYELDGRGGWERAEGVFARLASIEDAESMTNMEVYTLVQGGKNA